MANKEKDTVAITLFLPRDIHSKLKDLVSIRRLRGNKATIPQVTVDKLGEALNSDPLLKTYQAVLNGL